MAPRRSAARRLSGLGAIALAAALPLSLLATGTGQAAPPLTVAQAQEQLAVLQAQQDMAVEAFDRGRIALDTAQRQVAAAQATVRHSRATVLAAQAQAAVFARSAYTGTPVDPVTGLLAGGDASLLIDRVGNLDQVARLRASRTTAMRAAQVQLQEVQAAAEAKAAAAATRQRELEAARSQVQSLIRAQQQLLDRLQADERRKLLAAQEAQRQAAAAAAARAQQDAAAAAARALAAPAPVQAASTSRGVARQAPVPVAAAPSPAPAPGNSSVASTVLAAAYSQQGKPYAYGAAGPDAYDCSGLTMWAFAHAGISLPHSADGQYGYGTHVSVSQLQPGDLVFFAEGGSIYHVGIYTGGGNMIDANHTGGWVGVRSMAYYTGLIGGTRF